MQVKRSILFIAFIVILTSACSGENVHEKIMQQLEETLEMETEFEKSQTEILKLEEEDEALYNQMIQLTPTEEEELINLSEQALALLRERLKYLEMERDSLEHSREAFEQIEPMLVKITNTEHAELAKQMYDTMIRRYEIYEDVYEKYVSSVQLTEDLYKKMQKKANEPSFYRSITEVNESYEAVFIANEQFNNATAAYNELKKAYYEAVREE